MLNYAYGSRESLDEWSTVDVVDLYAFMHKYLFGRFQSHLASAARPKAEETVHLNHSLGFINAFLHVLQYPELQVEALRNEFRDVALRNVKLLTGRPEFEKVLDAWPTLAKDLLLSTATQVDTTNYEREPASKSDIFAIASLDPIS